MLSWKDWSAILNKRLPLLAPRLIFLLSLSWWEAGAMKEDLQVGHITSIRTQNLNMATPGCEGGWEMF